MGDNKPKPKVGATVTPMVQPLNMYNGIGMFPPGMYTVGGYNNTTPKEVKPKDVYGDFTFTISSPSVNINKVKSSSKIDGSGNKITVKGTGKYLLVCDFDYKFTTNTNTCAFTIGSRTYNIVTGNTANYTYNISQIVYITDTENIVFTYTNTGTITITNGTIRIQRIV